MDEAEAAGVYSVGTGGQSLDAGGNSNPRQLGLTSMRSPTKRFYADAGAVRLLDH